MCTHPVSGLASQLVGDGDGNGPLTMRLVCKERESCAPFALAEICPPIGRVENLPDEIVQDRTHPLGMVGGLGQGLGKVVPRALPFAGVENDVIIVEKKSPFFARDPACIPAR